MPSETTHGVGLQWPLGRLPANVDGTGENADVAHGYDGRGVSGNVSAAPHWYLSDSAPKPNTRCHQVGTSRSQVWIHSQGRSTSVDMLIVNNAGSRYQLESLWCRSGR